MASLTAEKDAGVQAGTSTPILVDADDRINVQKIEEDCQILEGDLLELPHKHHKTDVLDNIGLQTKLSKKEEEWSTPCHFKALDIHKEGKTGASEDVSVFAPKYTNLSSNMSSVRAREVQTCDKSTQTSESQSNCCCNSNNGNMKKILSEIHMLREILENSVLGTKIQNKDTDLDYSNYQEPEEESMEAVSRDETDQQAGSDATPLTNYPWCSGTSADGDQDTLPKDTWPRKSSMDPSGPVTEISSSMDMIGLPEGAEVRIRQSLQQEVKRTACSKGNFAWGLAKRVYREDELIGRNISGAKGKRVLSPRRRIAIEHAIYDNFGSNEENMRTMFTAINTGIRNITRKRGEPWTCKVQGSPLFS